MEHRRLQMSRCVQPTDVFVPWLQLPGTCSSPSRATRPLIVQQTSVSCASKYYSVRLARPSSSPLSLSPLVYPIPVVQFPSLVLSSSFSQPASFSCNPSWCPACVNHCRITYYRPSSTDPVRRQTTSHPALHYLDPARSRLSVCDGATGTLSATAEVRTLDNYIAILIHARLTSWLLLLLWSQQYIILLVRGHRYINDYC